MKIHLNYFTYGLIVSALMIISGRIEAANYYVDKDASGSNNGSSWTNAWESFSDINWSVIGPGDIVYISGGPSGKTYTSGLSIGASGTSGSPVTITKGIDANHNGNVILSGSGGTGIILNNHHDVVISNLMLNGWGTAVSLDGGTSNATYNIVLDNLDGEMAGRYVHIEGYPDVTGSYCHDITIRNCDVTTVTDVNDQTDFIYAQYMKGLIIEDNHVVISNENPSPHCDAIQTYYVDGPVIVRNNYFEHADHKTRNSQGIFFENHEGDYYVYNNIVVMPNSLDGKIYWKSSSVNNAHTYIYSNTIYGLSGNLIETTDPNAVIKNNILYSTGYQSNGSTYMLIFNGVSGNNAQVSNNLFYDPAGNMNNMNSGSNQNGVDGNPIFTNINGRDFTVQSGSPAIDMGANLGNSYNVDMVGTSRPQGQSYDAGAYEKVTGGGGNIPPNQPSNPSPANGAQNQGINTTLSWNCSDPNGDPITYNVYFGTSVNPPVVSNGQTAKNYNPGQLENNTTYYWKIIASDGQGGTSTSPVWSFSTIANGNTPPNSPSNPDPSNGAIGQQLNLSMSWSCTDPDGDPLIYDIYFGTANNPPLVVSSQTGTNFSPSLLNDNTTYYWKIVAKDDQGASAASPIWGFTTIAGSGGDNIPPELMGVQSVQTNQVVLDFSEPLDTTSAVEPANYVLSEQVQVLGIELNPSYKRVVLTTTPQTINHVYTVEVSNIKDTAGNEISSQANSLFFKPLEIGSTGYSEYLIDNVNASATTDTNTSPIKTLDGLVNEDPDPNSRWAAQIMPQWIGYDLGAVKPIGMVAVSFYLWNSGRIYHYSIQVSNDQLQWEDLVTNEISSSQEWTINEFQDISARFIRITCLDNNQSDWAGIWESRIFEPLDPTAVEYTAFTANVNDKNKVVLKWSTATEQNCEQFNITRKKDGGNLELIGSVKGNGSISYPRNYQYVDNSISSGHYSYRLEEVDFSGNVQYSNIVKVEVNMPEKFVLEQNYPNPFNPSTYINYSVPRESPISLKIYDILGKEVETLVNEKQTEGSYQIEFNAYNLPSGIYFCRMQSEDFVSIKKMILLR